MMKISGFFMLCGGNEARRFVCVWDLSASACWPRRAYCSWPPTTTEGRIAYQRVVDVIVVARTNTVVRPDNTNVCLTRPAAAAAAAVEQQPDATDAIMPYQEQSVLEDDDRFVLVFC